MRHRRRTRTLGCRTSHRKAMMRNMVTSLFEHGRIETTVIRAKELRRLADQMVTLAKDGGLHARRQACAVIRSRDVVNKLFGEIGQRFVDRNGGYTRVVRTGPRRGDGAMLAVIELATEPLEKLKSRRAPQRPTVKETVIPEAAPVKEQEEASVEAVGEEVAGGELESAEATETPSAETQAAAASEQAAEESESTDVSATEESASAEPEEQPSEEECKKE